MAVLLSGACTVCPTRLSSCPSRVTGSNLAERPNQAETGEKIALLVIAHGSRRQQWNRMFTDLERPLKDRLDSVLGAKAAIWQIKLCFLECEPTIASAMAQLQRDGCQRVIAVPLFIAPSGHSRWDVPAALGLYSDPHQRKVMQDEGAQPTDSRIPVMLTGPLSTGVVLEQWAAEQIKKISHKPDDEAVVILAHGSPTVAGLWEKLMRRVASNICGTTGITYADWAFVAVGQGYRGAGMAAINQARQVRKRVLVIGLYVGLSAERINKIWGKGQADEADVVFVGKGLLPDEKVITWIVDSARAALKGI